MIFWNLFTFVFCTLGVLFFVAGTVGLIRFPDIYCRIHALTKADNLGVGLIAVGLAPQMPDMFQLFKLFLIWILILISSATSCHLVAQHEFNKRPQPAQPEQTHVD